MRRVLLLATTTGYQIRMFGEAAERLGVRLVYATDRCDQLDDPWADGAIPVRFHQEGAAVDAILAATSGGRCDGILVVGDRPTVVAAHVAGRLGLPGNSADGAAAARDKRITRARLQRAGLPAPAFRVVAAAADPRSLVARCPWPVVVKPAALSGSRGVIRANNPAEFVAAFERLQRLLASPEVRRLRDPAADDIIVESFIEGTEYAVEGVFEHGVFRALAIFDKPDPLDGPFFEETVYVTPSRAAADQQALIVAEVARAAQGLGLRHGPVHAECRVNPSGVFVLEVAARPIGGLCARALGFNGPEGQRAGLEELLLRHALGESLQGWARERIASGVMMIPIPSAGILRGVDGVADAKAVAGVTDVRVTAKIDQELVPLPEGASYLGFIFAKAESAAEVEAALRMAHARLSFAIERKVPMFAGS